jgi:hypothetical protein
MCVKNVFVCECACNRRPCVAATMRWGPIATPPCCQDLTLIKQKPARTSGTNGWKTYSFRFKVQKKHETCSCIRLYYQDFEPMPGANLRGGGEMKRRAPYVEKSEQYDLSLYPLLPDTLVRAHKFPLSCLLIRLLGSEKHTNQVFFKSVWVLSWLPTSSSISWMQN